MKLLLPLSLAVSVCATTGFTLSSAPQDPIGHWRLDESSGTTATDDSANGFDGDVHNGLWSTGVLDGALGFDGSTSFVELTDGAGVPDMIGNLQQGTVSVWFRIDSIPDVNLIHPLVYLGDGIGAVGHAGLIIEVGHFTTGTKLYFTIYDGNPHVPQCFDTGFDLEIGEWYHFAAVVGPGFNTGYLNGAELLNRHYNFGGPTHDLFFDDIPHQLHAWLGRGYFATVPIEQFLDGAIDEVRIYDRPLGAQEILQHYLEVRGGDHPPSDEPTFCAVRSPGIALGPENASAPTLPTLPGDAVDLVILGQSENLGFAAQLQTLIDADPPVSGVSFQVVDQSLPGEEAWQWATPGEAGYQRIDDLIGNQVRPAIVLGLFTNEASFPIQEASVGDPDYDLYVDDLLSIADHLYNSGRTAPLIYLSAHRYKPLNLLPCWFENLALGSVMERASGQGMDYLKPGPEQHELHRCCYPDCYKTDLEHPNPAGSQLMAQAWHALLLREFRGLGELCGGAPNSAGTGASLIATGTTQLSANDLVLVLDAAPANEFGVLFWGTPDGFTPFGDGVRCVGGTLQRFGAPKLIGAQGQLSLPLDNALPPMNHGTGGISAGDSRGFQFWYRDPGAASAGFNLSSGLEVVFLP